MDSGHKIELHLVDCRKFIFRVCPTNGRTEISTGALTLIWACSNLNIVFYSLLQKLGALGKKVEIDPENYVDLKAAIKLVGWSLNFVFGDTSEPDWPVELPRPTESFDKDSPVFASSSLALGTLGFIILHEVSHVVLEHDGSKKGFESHLEEFDADGNAVRLYLDGAADDAPTALETRQIHIVSGMLVFCLHPMFTQRWGGRKHPPEWQRLDKVMTQMELEHDGEIQMFASQIKNLYSSVSGRGSGGSFEGPSDSLNQFFEDLAEESREDPPTRTF